MLFTRNQAWAALALTVAALMALGVRLSMRSGSGGETFIPAVADSAVLEQAAARARLRSQPLNVNSATSSQLQTLDGIGPVLADRIVAERERGGPFAGGDELAERVRGMGPVTVSALAGRITFSPDSARRDEGW